MTAPTITLYDSTLRDGSQARGVDFSLSDKQAIARALDELGIDYIEGGFPGANPTDDAFFAAPPPLAHARLTAFGMTRRAGRSAANDPALAAMIDSGTKHFCVVGKASRFQAETALGITEKDNLDLIADSIARLAAHGEVLFDAEHFFDGFKEDTAFALRALEAAQKAGARWIVLCDTNGGSLPHEVEEITREITRRIEGEQIGIHCHNDTEQAVANSLAAVRAGARQVQGTLNGVGERCGNANLVSIIPTLMLKMGYKTSVSEEALRRLTVTSRLVDDRLNRTPDLHAAYVGSAAFAHKGGLHGSGVARNSRAYEHIDPQQVGNERAILVSDKAGRANIAAYLKTIGLERAADDPDLPVLIERIKAREAEGFSYESADASLELLARRVLHAVPDYFELTSFRVIDERRWNARNERITLSEATIKVIVDGELSMTVAEGNGPVNALDTALRRALSAHYPSVAQVRLVDYKVRILTPEDATRAVTRVMIESADETGRHWKTIGVSSNVIDASYMALHDSLTWHLLKNTEDA